MTPHDPPPPAGGFGYHTEAEPPFGLAVVRPPLQPSMAYAYWTLGTGIFSLAGLALCLLGLPFAVGAIAMGVHHAKRCRRHPDLYAGRGIAIAGAVCGGFSLVASILVLVSCCFFFWGR